MKKADPPLLEVILQLQFDRAELPKDRVQYFYRMNSDLLPETGIAEKPQVASFQSIDGSDLIAFSEVQSELRSQIGVSFPRLRSRWTRILDSFLDIFSIPAVTRVSLSYLNEIPLEDLRSFRSYVNIGFDMPTLLYDRFEFFRSEFTYKYDFGLIKVWLQPDWDEAMESYCIQLNLLSIHEGLIERSELLFVIQQLHDGIKDVFRQILSEAYIKQLPQ